MNKFNFSDEQLEIINYYSDNNNARLRRMCDPIIFWKGVSQMYWDDLYDVASYTLLESVTSFDIEKGAQFNTYLRGNIERAFYDWSRDNMRGKRCNLLRDKNGTIIRDEKGQPTVVANVSLDAPNEDGIDFAEKIDSGFRIENELSNEIGLSTDNKWEEYLRRLSKTQRKIAIYLSNGYKPVEIKEILHISNREYTDHMSILKSYENISILF